MENTHVIKQNASDWTMHPTYIYIRLRESNVPRMGDTEVNKMWPPLWKVLYTSGIQEEGQVTQNIGGEEK